MKSGRSKATPGVPATDMPVEIPASSLAVLTIRIPGGLWQIIQRRGPFRGALNPIIHRHLCHHVPSFHFQLQLWLREQLSEDRTGNVQPRQREPKEMSRHRSRSRRLNKEKDPWWSRGVARTLLFKSIKDWISSNWTLIHSTLIFHWAMLWS